VGVLNSYVIVLSKCKCSHIINLFLLVLSYVKSHELHIQKNVKNVEAANPSTQLTCFCVCKCFEFMCGCFEFIYGCFEFLYQGVLSTYKRI